MLTQLLPDQIAKFWPVIKYAVEEALPPTVGSHLDKMNRVLSGMLSGKLDVWVSYKRRDEDVKFEGIVVTQILYDDASDTRNLLIYSVYSYSIAGKASWIEGYETLIKYAKSKKCSNLVAFAANENIVNLVKGLGADTSFTYISFPIPKIV